MLKHIYIKNFAIISELDLEFFDGMVVLTGETGAGKSIIIDAIELALGKRASCDVVRVGVEKADICVEFNISNIKDAIYFLHEHDLNDENNCLVRRVIYKDGRSKSSINGVPVTQQILREFSEILINIYGQHEFQTILKHEHQRSLLDNFSKNDDVLNRIKTIYTNWRKAKAEFDLLNQSNQNIHLRTDFLKYQIQEFEDLNLHEGEIEEIEQEFKELSNADLLLNNYQEALLALDNDTSDSFSAICALNKAYQSILSLVSLNPSLENIIESLNNLIVEAKEVSNDLRFLFDKTELNPERLNFLESRLRVIYDLSRKHKVEPKELINVHNKILNELNQLEGNDGRLKDLKIEIEKLENDYFEVADVLSKKRRENAEKFSSLVTNNMKQLGMPNGKLNIVLEPINIKETNLYGLEKVMFLVSANSGQPFKPLNQVASGGELSRISLAIQVITAENNKVPTLIFDEVDVGIGGAVSEIVGKLLREIGGFNQVICITHLPQVAAKGHHHLRVEKMSDDSKTDTKISYLTKDDRIQEIARMLGGIKITKQVLAHAKEML